MGHSGLWWTFAFGIALFVLQFPLSVLANLFTPKLKDWWAARSVISIQSRIAKLTERLASLEKEYPLITETESQMLWLLIQICDIAVVILQLGVVILLIVTVFAAPTLDIGLRHALELVAGLAFTVGYIFHFVVIVPAKKYRVRRAPGVRLLIKRDIESLEEKLQSKR